MRATNKQKSPPSSLGDGSRFLSGGVQHIGLPGALHRLSISRERHFSASRRRRQRKGVRSRPLHLTAAATSLCLRSQASCHRPLGLRCHAVPPHNSWCGVGFSCSLAHTLSGFVSSVSFGESYGRCILFRLNFSPERLAKRERERAERASRGQFQQCCCWP